MSKVNFDFYYTFYICCHSHSDHYVAILFLYYRGVAQLASVPRSGRGGRKFESSHPDLLKASLAQLVEQLIRNEQVAGSNPVRGSKK